MNTVEVLGTVGPDGTLQLDEKLNVPPGRVRVRVETVPAETLSGFVDRTRAELAAAGHRFRTREEIDAEINELRDEWEERLEELDRSRERP
jgi:hypothetical protein